MLKTSPIRRRFRKIASVFGALALCAASIGAVAPALMDPGPAVPVARGLELSTTEAARGAYIDAMKAQGYEILPPVQIADANLPAR